VARGALAPVSAGLTLAALVALLVSERFAARAAKRDSREAGRVVRRGAAERA
ncbi:MFS transporter, partial [Burkholderia gladioli]